MGAELPVGLLFFVAFVGLFAFAMYFAARHSERVHRNQEQLAARLGLVLPPQRKRWGFWPAARATGQFRGRPTELYTFSTGSGKSREQWAALATTPSASAGLTFHLTRQGLGTRIAELFGAREITVGDPAFDSAWFVQTNQPEFLAAALIPELRARLTAAVDASGRAYRASLKLEIERVVYAEAGDFSNEQLCGRMLRVAEVLSDLADVAEVFAQTQPRR